MASKTVKKRKVKRRRTRKRPRPRPEPHIKRDPVKPQDIRLVEGKGSDKHGGGAGGHYWHIYNGDKRAGHIFINLISDEYIGPHASVQIFLNQAERGKQIGRIAYRLACEISGYDTVYAHMRKSNKASIRAAEEAGFAVVDNKDISQRTMVWRGDDSSTVPQ
jgi:RimJ/RimL family protein N-acetyltransferase